MPTLYGIGDRVQGFVHAGFSLFWMSCTLSLILWYSSGKLHRPAAYIQVEVGNEHNGKLYGTRNNSNYHGRKMMQKESVVVFKKKVPCVFIG